MKKIYFFISLLMAFGITNLNAQLLQWNTFGNTGLETFEPSTFNDANLSGITNLTQGAGITPAANGDRFGGSNWWNTGNSVNSTLAEAITGNDYLEFIVTPNGGFSFTPTSFVFSWDHSPSGPGSVTLRSSVDGFLADLGTVTGMPAAISTGNTINITGLTALTTATTFRLYGYGGGTTAGTGGFDVAASAVNVQLNGTTAPTGSPLINVSPATLTGFAALSGVPSAVQTYTVDGINLTTDISITPPAGYQISPTGVFTPTNPILLTPVGGTVNSTTIQVRLNSATLGVNAGNISHTSTGATTKNVALTGNVLAPQPIVQSTITFGAVTNSTIVLNFSGGDGANRILVARQGTAVNSNPVDGTTYSGNSVFGLGAQLGAGNFAVYVGTGNTQLVSGLTAGATYHFAVYEFNDLATAGAENYLVPGGIANQATIDVPVIYTWIGGSSLWTTAANWAPPRLFPATNDILLFLDGTTETVTNLPNQSIGQLHVTLGTNVTLQAAVTTTALTINGLIALDDLTIDATSALNISGANSYTINLTAGTTAIIDGDMTFTAGAHKLTAADASGVTFKSGAVFTAGTGFSSNPFGIANLNSIVFANGSRYDYTAGSNPFGAAQPNSVVIFQPGSLFRVLTNLVAAFSGRTYANFELDNAAYSTPSTGNAPLSIDNLTITNGILNLNLTGGISIKGNIFVAAAQTLTFNPASANTLIFNGTTAQSITNLGTLTFTANENVNINNAAGVTLNAPILLLGTLTFTNGLINTTSTNLLTLAAGSFVTGASNASFVNGPVSKIGNTAFVFPIGKTTCGPLATANGYAALQISFFTGGTVTDLFTAEYKRGDAMALGSITPVGLNHVSRCDYWTLTRDAGTATVDITLSWDEPINNCVTTAPYVNNRPSLTIAHNNNIVGSTWDSYGVAGQTSGTNVTGTVTWGGGGPQSSAFGAFAIASIDFNNPLPISIMYFTGSKQNSSHLLNWKVTCNSTPSATMQLVRSTDGINFTDIYAITATALQCQQPFNYTDAYPAKGVNYYRLKITDTNGKITYSSTVSLINATKEFDVMDILPNPIVSGLLNLKISAAKKMQLHIVITDMQGRVLQKQMVSLIAGFNTIPMPVQNLAAGIYHLFGNTADEKTRVLRFIVQ